MTSVATIMGAMPIAFGLGAGSISRRPLGYAIVGGVFFSTLLTLFLVPAVYVIFEGSGPRTARRRRASHRQPVARGGGGVMLLLLLALLAGPPAASCRPTRCPTSR